MLLVTLGILLGLLALAVPVAAALGILGLSLSALYSKLPLTLAIGEIAWGTSNNFLLVAIPFFVLLGEILLRSGMAERMYNALVLWMPWLPGGLMHSNIAACAMFAADLGFERRDRRDDRHRRLGRDREARLFGASVPRHASRPAARWAS